MFVECFLCARHYVKYGTSLALAYLISIERKNIKGQKNRTDICDHTSAGSATNGPCWCQHQAARWSQD